MPTLDGKGKLRVPPGTQPGTVLRIKGKGIPHRGGAGRGDQRVEVAIEVPTQLTERSAAAAGGAGEGARGGRATRSTKSFMEKLRELFD